MAAATTPDAAEAANLEQLARDLDRARLKQIGGYHFVFVIGALTLWGAAQTWAEASGLGIASFAAIGAALIAGTVLTSTIHEWGHFAGARLSGAVSPALEEPRRHFFMFDFPIDQNDLRQFSWMSWGGILAPWLNVLAVLLFVPLGTLSACVLLATLLSRSISIAVFEAPVVQAAQESGEPAAELGKRVAAGGLDRGRSVGMAAGFVAFAILWLVA